MKDKWEMIILGVIMKKLLTYSSRKYNQENNYLSV